MMFLEILRTLLQVICVFSILLVAFALAFFMLMNKEVFFDISFRFVVILCKNLILYVHTGMQMIVKANNVKGLVQSEPKARPCNKNG